MRIRNFLAWCLSVLMVCASCKKNNDDPVELNLACDPSAKFKISLNEAINPVSICESADQSIYILGVNGENAKVVRVSATGTLIGDKEYGINTAARLQNLIALNRNSFLFSATTEEVFDSSVCFPYTAWYATQYQTDSTHECVMQYVIQTGDGIGTLPRPNASHLFKVDSSLNTVWEKEFDGFSFSGRSLARYDDHHFIFMTYHAGGMVPHPVIDTYGVFLDTVKYDFYNNSVTVYQLDEDGNTVWQTDVNGIYSGNFFAPEYGCEVVSDGSNIYLRMEREIILLNGNGVVQSRFNVHGYCDEELRGIVATGINGFVVKGYDLFNGYPDYFMTQFNGNGSVVWDHTGISNGNSIILSNNGSGIIDYSAASASKYDADGTTIWSRDFDMPNNGNSYYTTAGCSCNGGVIVVAKNDLSDLLIYKTDVNGGYQ